MMSRFQRCIAAAIACVVCTAFSSCGSKGNKVSGLDVDIQNSETADILTETEEVQESRTLPPIVTQPSAEEVQSETEAAEIVQTEVNPENSTKYEDYMSVLNTYHQSYLENNIEMIYSLFNRAEINAFQSYMRNYYEDYVLDFDSIFDKENVMQAIADSVENINVLKSEHADSPEDVWVVTIDAANLEHLETEDLESVIMGMGVAITDGYYCEYPYYENQTKGEKFVAEPAAAIQIDGSWYISYSVAMDRLVEFMNIG